jgi:hypothetical protein
MLIHFVRRISDKQVEPTEGNNRPCVLEADEIIRVCKQEADPIVAFGNDLDQVRSANQTSWFKIDWTSSL